MRPCLGSSCLSNVIMSWQQISLHAGPSCWKVIAQGHFVQESSELAALCEELVTDLEGRSRAEAAMIGAPGIAVP